MFDSLEQNKHVMTKASKRKKVQRYTPKAESGKLASLLIEKETAATSNTWNEQDNHHYDERSEIFYHPKKVSNELG